jgi:hypothetical protein
VYVLERPPGKDESVAVVDWISDESPSVEASFTEVLRRIPAIINSVPEIQAENRLRLALLEDILAEAFACDLHEEPSRFAHG